MHSRKIFGIGFHKTGTTTLEAATELLGFSTAPVRTDLVKSLSRGGYGKVWSVADAYEVFQDNPWPILYRELYERYPEAKFILTWRSDEDWIKSVRNSFGGKSTPMREWIYGKGQGDPAGNEDLFLERYREHNRQVRAFFEDKPGQLLELNWAQGDGWAKLCPFLGVPEPAVDFPHANKGNYLAKKKGWRLFSKKKP